MEVYKYILNCNNCNHHLLFNESDTQITKEKVGYVCEIHTKRKSALNKIYYISFNDLNDLIEIIRKNEKDQIFNVMEKIKVTKFVICPNCGEKIILNSKIFYDHFHYIIDSYNWNHLWGEINNNEFLKSIL